MSKNTNSENNTSYNSQNKDVEKLTTLEAYIEQNIANSQELPIHSVKKDSDSSNTQVANQELVTSKIIEFISETCDEKEIFYYINHLSTLKYESENCTGNLTILLSNDSNIELNICFKETVDSLNTVSFSNGEIKFLRKLLQLTQKDTTLLIKKSTNNKWIPLGIAKLSLCKNLPTFSIKGDLHWFFSFVDEKIECKNHTFLNKSQEKISPELKTLLPEKYFEPIKILAEGIDKSPEIHGSLLIFIDDEHLAIIQRLCKFKRGILLDNPKLSLSDVAEKKEFFLSLCKIDGALVFNKSTGELIAIGVILDGKVLCDGDIGRGSRFNSTKTFTNFYTFFYEEKFCNAIGLVISEDGYIDLIHTTRELCKEDEKKLESLENL